MTDEPESEHDEAMRVAVEAIFDGDHTLFEAATKKLDELPVEEGKFRVTFGTGHMYQTRSEYTCRYCGKHEVRTGVAFVPPDMLPSVERMHWYEECPAWRFRFFRWKWHAPVVSKMVRWWHRPGEPRNPLKRKKYREHVNEMQQFIDQSKQ